jgi:hypothetical protein
MVIGDFDDEVPVPEAPEPLEPLHAAAAPAVRTVMAVTANMFLENQRRSGLTAGSSFLSGFNGGKT